MDLTFKPQKPLPNIISESNEYAKQEKTLGGSCVLAIDNLKSSLYCDGFLIKIVWLQKANRSARKIATIYG
jgi:hypothetical protein